MVTNSRHNLSSHYSISVVFFLWFMNSVRRFNELTTVWTMCGRCIRKLFTVWNTSIKPSAFTRSRILLRAINVPVRPAPALHNTQTHTGVRHYTHSRQWQWLSSVCVCACVTCSARLWDGCPTAAVVSERMRWCQSFLYLRLGSRSPASRGNESVELNVCVYPAKNTHTQRIINYTIHTEGDENCIESHH